jgi:hypothetical protein
MHGAIFVLFKKYVEERGGASAWESVREDAGVAHRLYQMIESYPDEEALALVAAAARRRREPLPHTLEDFGTFLVPELLKVYGALVRKDWRTLELLENTERAIHTAIRLRDKNAAPPRIQTSRVAPASVEIVYTSRRRLCALARGIVRGIAAHYGDPIEITERECMTRGDHRCVLCVSVLPGLA